MLSSVGCCQQPGNDREHDFTPSALEGKQELDAEESARLKKLWKKLAEGGLDNAAALIQLSNMIQTIDALVQGAIELPPDQRFALAQRILASVEPEEAAGTDDAWTEEIRKRIRRYDSGEIKGILGAEVFAEIDLRLAP